MFTALRLPAANQTFLAAGRGWRHHSPHIEIALGLHAAMNNKYFYLFFQWSVRTLGACEDLCLAKGL